MKEQQSTGDPIHVEVITRQGCAYSLKTIESLLMISHRHPELTLTIMDAAEVETTRRTFGGITPSIWVNDQLWFLGSFDFHRFQRLIDTI